MTTQRLYYTDSYLHNFDARVVDTSEDGLTVYLDRTAFYPTSGGQPHDVGYLNEARIVDVIDEEDRIAHHLDQPIAGTVTGRIDWHVRYDRMQQHTGQHLLSAVLEDLFHIQTLSFHMGRRLAFTWVTKSRPLN